VNASISPETYKSLITSILSLSWQFRVTRRSESLKSKVRRLDKVDDLLWSSTGEDRKSISDWLAVA
jgi:hypothetical protein